MIDNVINTISEWASSLSEEQIENLSDEKILKMAIQRPGRPTQKGFILKIEHFESPDHYRKTFITLMKRLAKARADKEIK